MQISQNVVETLSAQGKGYMEAVLKLTEGQRLIGEAMDELAHLDGNTKGRRLQSPGGKIITPPKTAKRSPISREDATDKMFHLLKKGPLSTAELAAAVGCSGPHVRTCLTGTKGITREGSGMQTRWVLGSRSSVKRAKKTVANKTTRRPPRHLTEVERPALVLEAVKAGEGFASLADMVRYTGIEFNYVKKALNQLKRDGQVIVEKKRKDVKGAAERPYWVAV